MKILWGRFAQCCLPQYTTIVIYVIMALIALTIKLWGYMWTYEWWLMICCEIILANILGIISMHELHRFSFDQPVQADDTGFWTLLKIGHQNQLVNHILLYVSLLNWWLFEGTIMKFPIFSETPICLSLTLKYLCCWAYTVKMMFLCVYIDI